MPRPLIAPFPALAVAHDTLAQWYGSDWLRFPPRERIAMTIELANKDIADHYRIDWATLPIA